MSTGTLNVQSALAGHPDFGPVTMRYDEGGRFEIWQMGTRSVRVKAGTPPDQIKRAFDEDCEAFVPPDGGKL